VYIANTRFENIATHPTAPGMSHDPLIVYGSGMYHGNNRSFNCGERVLVVSFHRLCFLRGLVSQAVLASIMSRWSTIATVW
jgi:hypothetical protein